MVRIIFTLFAGVCSFALSTLPGCDTTGPGTTKLRPVSNLQAYSKSATEVGLTWSTSLDANLADEHHIRILGPSTDRTQSALNTATAVVIGSLIEGSVYTFSVSLDNHSDPDRNSDPMTIQWSPAKRLDTEGGLEIKVYETASPNFPSALVFLHPTTAGPKTVSLSNPTPRSDTLLVDVYLRTESSTVLLIRSAHLYSGSFIFPRITRFSSVFRNTASLDDPQAVPPDTNTYSASNTSVTIDTPTVSTSRIHYFKGVNGNYGRILVQRNSANGSLIWGTSPDRYINVKISYQSTPYNPYVKPVRINELSGKE